MLSILKLYKTSHESRLSYISEYWCHHTSLISEAHHSPRPCNTFSACILMIMPFVFSEAVIECEIYQNESLAWRSVLQANALYCM